MSTAVTLEPATVFRVEKRAMLQALHTQPDLSEKFMARKMGLIEYNGHLTVRTELLTNIVLHD